MKNLVNFLINFTITLFELFMVCNNYSLSENTKGKIGKWDINLKQIRNLDNKNKYFYIESN